MTTLPASHHFADESAALGKRARTRARLLDAAVDVIAERGLEAASVQEMAARADVANGTFYNHFRTKEEIVSEVVLRVAAATAERLDAAMSDIEGAAERVACGTRSFVEFAASQPAWAHALLQSATSLPEGFRAVTTWLRADIERGIEQGVFKVDADELLLETLMTIVGVALRALLEERANEDVGVRAAEYQLRMLGVPAARAARIAARATPHELG